MDHWADQQEVHLHFSIFFEESKMRLFRLIAVPLSQLTWGQEGVADSLCNPHDTVCVEVIIFAIVEIRFLFLILTWFGFSLNRRCRISLTPINIKL
jgi:hypothetical protein